MKTIVSVASVVAASTASASVMSIPDDSAAAADPFFAAVAATDPIFAAIENHRAKQAALERVVALESDLEQQLPVELRQSIVRHEPVVGDDPRWLASLTAIDDAITQEGHAADDLVDILPTTLAGVIALLEYSVELGRRGHVWQSGYQIAGATSEYVRHRGVSWEVMLHAQVANALARIIDNGCDAPCCWRALKSISETAHAVGSQAPKQVAEAYCEWLHMEHRLAAIELYGDYRFTPANTLAGRFHFPAGLSSRDMPPPSTRAVAVLRAAGVNLNRTTDQC